MAYTTIDNPTLYFEATTYTGGATDVSSLSFQPDWVWAKKRSGSENHGLFDSVRGTTQSMNSNTTAAESARSGSLTSFDSDGWTMGGSDGIISASGSTYVGWAWRAGGTASSNSDGSITSSVSANTTAGFSICAWNGNSGTVGHGLGVKPDVIWIKSRQTVNNWVVLHKNLTGGMDANGIVLNDTAAETSGGSGMAEPTSSVFTITGGLAANDNNIGYVFAEKKGYSKFGQYQGNGNADGTFVHTGFRPAWIIAKNRSSTSGWGIYDNKRNTFNVMDLRLLANTNGADDQSTDNSIDFLSNGFKHRTASGWNSAATYIYMAFAENPFVTAGTKAAGTAR